MKNETNVKPTQEKNARTETFLQRCKALAGENHLNIEEFAELIGISRVSFWAYRNGKRNVSSRSWKKLEAAEREAGIGPGIGENITNPNHSSEVNPENVNLADVAARLVILETQVRIITAALASVLPPAGIPQIGKITPPKKADLALVAEEDRIYHVLGLDREAKPPKLPSTMPEK